MDRTDLILARSGQLDRLSGQNSCSLVAQTTGQTTDTGSGGSSGGCHQGWWMSHVWRGLGRVGEG